jgi:hypothetical protein
MKTAVSIPDDVFQDAERLAVRLQTSRSRLYAQALAEFVARHDEDGITLRLDQVVREANREAQDDNAAFVRAAAAQAMRQSAW